MNETKLTLKETLTLIKASHLNPLVKPKSFLLVGESGIGKTEGIEGIARELNIGYYNIRTPEIEPYDLVGNWDPKTSQYVTPLLPKKGEEAIILMDEINRGQIPTMQACMRIMEGRGTSTFHYEQDKQTIVAAANPVSDDDVVEVLGRALINRPYIIFVEPKVEEWVNWLNSGEEKIIAEKVEETKIKDLITSYLKKISLFLMTYPKYFIMKGTPEMAANFEAVPNPRNWYEAAKIITLFDIANIKRNIGARIATKVGFEASSDFQSFLEDPEPPVSGEQILKEFGKYKNIFVKHQQSAPHKAIASTHDLSIILNSKKSLSKQEMDNMKEFLESIKQDKEEIVMSLFNKINNEIFDSLFMNFPNFFDRNLKIINEIKKKFGK